MLSDHSTFQSGDLIVLTKKPNADASLFSGVSSGNIDIGTSLNGVINLGSVQSSINLVGETTATTQLPSDDSTKVATTAFVKAQGSSSNLLNQANTFTQEQLFVSLKSPTISSEDDLLLGNFTKKIHIPSQQVNQGSYGENFPTANQTITCRTYDKRDGFAIKAERDDMWFNIFINKNGLTIGQIANIGWSVRYNSNSDRRLKEEIQPMDSSLSKLMLLKPSKFKWKADPAKKQDYGFIAQEVFQVFPHFQSLEGENPQKDGVDVFHGLDYGLFTPQIIKAIQEMKIGYDAKIASLEARLLRLEMS